MTTEQRLERLERENRWMRRIGAVGVAVAAAVFLVGQGREREPQDLVVRSLTVKAPDGTVRADLRTLPSGGVYLRLTDKNGKTRAGLMVSADGAPSLNLIDKNGEVRATLAVAADGGPRLDLYDKNSRARAGLVVTADGAPSLSLDDENGKTRAVLGVATTVNKLTGAETKTAENTLTMYDAKGNVIWQAPR